MFAVYRSLADRGDCDEVVDGTCHPQESSRPLRLCGGTGLCPLAVMGPAVDYLVRQEPITIDPHPPLE